jgi:hypothetical protein
MGGLYEFGPAKTSNELRTKSAICQMNPAISEKWFNFRESAATAAAIAP